MNQHTATLDCAMRMLMLYPLVPVLGIVSHNVHDVQVAGVIEGDEAGELVVVAELLGADARELHTS